VPKLSGVQPLALELEGEALAAEELNQRSAFSTKPWATFPRVSLRIEEMICSVPRLCHKPMVDAQ